MRKLALFLILLTGFSAAQELRDHGDFLVYVPKGISKNQKVPLVVTFSPNGDPRLSIGPWKTVADRYRWLVYGTKSSRNGMSFDKSLGAARKELKTVFQEYPVDRNRLVCSGLSGGGMVSHAMAGRHPEMVRAVVINTGMMYEKFMSESYPRKGMAVMLASPTDFRYQETKRDRDFLKKKGWKVKWLEFKGGHTMAPSEVYLQAAAWLKARL